MPIFDHTHSKISEITLSFPEFARACKKSLHSITRLATPIFDHTHQNFFDQLLIYVNLYQHAKHQAILLICSGVMVDYPAI